jgi:hypothetical protein
MTEFAFLNQKCVLVRALDWLICLVVVALFERAFPPFAPSHSSDVAFAIQEACFPFQSLLDCLQRLEGPIGSCLGLNSSDYPLDCQTRLYHRQTREKVGDERHAFGRNRHLCRTDSLSKTLRPKGAGVSVANAISMIQYSSSC